MMIAFWFLLRKAFVGKWWILFFIVGGTLGNLSYLAVHHNPAGDFANWHGESLDLIFMGSNTPLAGASGGVMALWGASIAAAVRYWLLARRKGVVSRMEIGVIALVLPAVFQLFWFDLRSDVSVAGFAHQMGMVSGFLLALLAPLQGNVTVFASDAGRVGVRSMTVKGSKDMVVDVGMFLKPDFSDAADFVVARQEMHTLRGVVHRDKRLAGAVPEGSTEVFVVAGGCDRHQDQALVSVVSSSTSGLDRRIRPAWRESSPAKFCGTRSFFSSQIVGATIVCIWERNANYT